MQREVATERADLPHTYVDTAGVCGICQADRHHEIHGMGVALIEASRQTASSGFNFRELGS